VLQPGVRDEDDVGVRGGLQRSGDPTRPGRFGVKLPPSGKISSASSSPMSWARSAIASSAGSAPGSWLTKWLGSRLR
jgi:hypothetical protein